MDTRHSGPGDAEHAAELLELGDAFFELDRDWRILRVNARQEALSRKPRAETVGRTFAEVWPELANEGSRYWREYARCMAERVPVQFSEYYAPLDLWTGVTAYPTSTGGIAVFFRDLSAQKRLQLEQERLAEIVRSSDDAIVSKDLDGVVLTWNPGAERLFGYAAEEMIGQPIARLLPPDRAGEEDHILRELRAGRRFDHFETTRVRKDGVVVEVSVTVSPLRDARGEIVGASKIARDVTEQRRARRALRDREEQLRATVTELRAAQARLVEADRRKDEFLGMLSHELRNPLAPIRNALYLLERAQPGGPEARRATGIVGRQVAHLTRLVDDLLDVTRIARGKVELRRERLDLAALARRAAEDYRPLMQGRGLDLAVEVGPGPVPVTGDPARLTQVLGNLLNNAAKFTPAGGRVTLSLGTEGARAVVRVRDTGPGISPDVRPMLFEPFTQGEQTLARSEGGLGLGLSLVKGLVALHGGEVNAADAPGGGAELVVSLPLAGPEPDRDAPEPAAAVADPPHRRVLVVDDNRDAAETVADLARILGHEVDVAFDALDGLAKAARDAPDVVLCDIGLPGIDGYEFARRLRAREGSDHVRLVALSGYAQPEDVARASDAGFDAHLAKPADPERIAAILA